MKISIRENGKGPVIKFNNEEFYLQYPNHIWNKIPNDFKSFFMDNYLFLKSVHLPIMFNDGDVKLNTNYPIMKSFISFMQLMDIPNLGDSNSVPTDKIFKLFYDSNFGFKGDEINYPKLNFLPKNKSSVMSISFGKDSLFNFAVSREIGFDVHPVWVKEKGAPIENKYKINLIKNFEKEFSVKIEKIYNETMLLHKYKYFNIPSKTKYSLSHLMTEYAFLLIPYVIHHNAKNLIFGNEQSCNFNYINKDGYVCYPTFDQTVLWMKELNNILNVIFGTELNVSSFVEPLHDIAITKILHHRYPEIGKYQYSCFPDESENNRYERWCCHCSKCARLYIIFKALNIDTKKLGFKENMLSKEHMKHYSIFNGHDKDNPYDTSGVGRDEQVLAFLLAKNNGVKGELIEEFKKRFLDEAVEREDELRKTFFNIHSSTTIPKEIKQEVLSIFKEELSLN